MVRTFLIGGVAGAASVFGNTPVDVVKTRMQVHFHRYPDTVSMQISHFKLFMKFSILDFGNTAVL